MNKKGKAKILDFCNIANSKIDKLSSNSLLIEYLYLIILTFFIIYYSQQTIRYPDNWFKLDYNKLRAILHCYIVFKFAFTDKLVFSPKESILAVLLLFSFAYSTYQTGYTVVLDTALLILGAYKVRSTSILKTYIAVKLPFILGTIVCSQLGIFENLIYNQHGRIRESFGFIYPTDFAAQVFFLIVAWTLIRHVQISYLELTAFMLIALFLKLKSDTRCSVISICLVVCAVAFWKNFYFFKIKEKIHHIFVKINLWCCLISPYFFAIFMILLCRFYMPDNKIMALLNKMTTGRLKLGKKTFDYYDIQLYGQYIDMQGNGGTLEKPVDYTFIDCSYINILMRFGLIVFFVVLALITFLMIKNRENLLIVYLIMLICLHSVIEHHLFEFYYNILIILPFASFEPRKTKYNEKISP